MIKNNKNSYIEYLNQKKNIHRLSFITSCYHEYKMYQHLYQTAIKARKQNPKQSKKIERFLIDKTWEVEGKLRIFIKESLDIVNEIRDMGKLEKWLGKSLELFSSNEGFSQFKKKIYNKGKELSEKYEEFDINMVEEGFSYMNKYVKNITVEGNRLKMTTVRGEKEFEFFIDPKPQAGHLGRINSYEFFNTVKFGGKKCVISPIQTSLLGVNTCHSEKVFSPKKEGLIDVYGSFIERFAFIREMFYRHARVIDEVGLSQYVGMDPQLAIGVALVVVGVGFIVGAITEDDWNLGIFGVFLILAGIMFIGASIAGVSVSVTVG